MSNNKSSTTFTYYEPGRTFDGNCYEAAAKSIDQTNKVCKLLRKAISDTNVQARNAFMQRNLDFGREAQAETYEDSAEYKLLAKMNATVVAIQTKLEALQKAVSYDPKNPPKE